MTATPLASAYRGERGSVSAAPLPVDEMSSIRPQLLSGRRRADRYMTVVLAWQHVSYLVMAIAVPVLRPRSYLNTTVDLGLVAVATAASVGVFAGARRRGWFPRLAVSGHVVLCCALVGLVTVDVPHGQELTATNWSLKFALASAALAGAALPLRMAVGAVALLGGSELAVLVPRAATSGLSAGNILEVLNGLVWFAVIARISCGYLTRHGDALDAATARAIAAERERAATQARHEERLAQYAALHDTVLSTLTAIARGGLSAHDERVRLRCAREADYLRRLISRDSEASSAPASLLDALESAARHAECLGLVVTVQHGLPPALRVDPPIVRAFGGATKEALNNVHRHAAADQAWVTATEEQGRIRVLIVDRGRGFRSGPALRGFGTSQSIVARMEAVGGEAHIDSAPGEGTWVELVWPR